MAFEFNRLKMALTHRSSKIFILDFCVHCHLQGNRLLLNQPRSADHCWRIIAIEDSNMVAQSFLVLTSYPRQGCH